MGYNKFREIELGKNPNGLIENRVRVIDNDIYLLENCFYDNYTQRFIKSNRDKISYLYKLKGYKIMKLKEKEVDENGFIRFEEIDTYSVEKNQLGIDVSDVSEEQDFTAWSNANAKFVIVRTSVCRSNDYYYGSDSARKQIAKAQELNMTALPYHNSHFGSDIEKAIKEADYAVKKAKGYGLTNGFLALDYEWTEDEDVVANTKAVLAWMQRVSDLGFKPILYVGIHYLRTKLNEYMITSKFGRCLWFANYETEDALTQPNMEYFNKLNIDNVLIWQWTHNWTVDGQSPEVTMDGNILIKDLYLEE